MGVLDVLLQESLWTGDAEPAIISIQEFMLALTGDSELMTCIVPIEGIRFEGGVLETLTDGVWTPIAGTENIVTGISVVSGGFEVEQAGEYETLTGGCGDPCNQYPDTPSFDKSGTQRSCAIATGLTEWWFEKLQDSLDQAEAASDTVAALDLISLLFPPAYLFVDQITDAMNEWTEAGIGIVRALDTVEEREEFADALYCHLVDNGNEFTEAIWQEFRDEYIASMPPLLVYYDWFQNGAIVDRAHRESYAGGDGCGGFTCETQSYIDHFSSGLGELTYMAIAGIAGYYGTDGAWSASNGNTDAGCLVSTTPSSFPTKRSITVFIDLGEEKRVEKIAFKLKTQRNNATGAGCNVTWFNAAKTELSPPAINTTIGTSTSYVERSWNGSKDNVRYIRIGVVVDQTSPAYHPFYIDEIQADYKNMPD